MGQCEFSVGEVSYWILEEIEKWIDEALVYIKDFKINKNKNKILINKKN